MIPTSALQRTRVADALAHLADRPWPRTRRLARRVVHWQRLAGGPVPRMQPSDCQGVIQEDFMRRVRYSVAMSLDGYIAGPNGESD